MSQPTTLIMNPDTNTFADENDGLLDIPSWAALRGVNERTVKRWLKDEEIPGADQYGEKRKWLIPATAMRLGPEERDAARRAREAAGDTLADPPTLSLEPATAPAGTAVEIAFEEEEIADTVLSADLETILDRLPAYIPLRLGAFLMGLGIGYVRANPQDFGVLHRAGPNQADVMPKAVVAHRARLHVRTR